MIWLQNGIHDLRESPTRMKGSLFSVDSPSLPSARKEGRLCRRCNQGESIRTPHFICSPFNLQLVFQKKADSAHPEPALNKPVKKMEVNTFVS